MNKEQEIVKYIGISFPKKLGSRLYHMIERGAKSQGTFDPHKIFFLFEEECTAQDVKVLAAFLGWIHQDEATRSIGHGNYETRYQEFLQYVDQLMI